MAGHDDLFPTTTRVPPEQPRDPAGRADPFGRPWDGFALDAARRPADDTDLDQVFFLVGDPAFAAFRALVVTPPAPGERLLRLLRSDSPWG